MIIYEHIINNPHLIDTFSVIILVLPHVPI